MSTKHTPEQWRWGFFKHRPDLKEPCTNGTCTPFYEFRPISENHEFGNGTVLAVCDYGHILKIEDHWEQCVLASQGGDGGESDILVSDECADLIEATPWLLAALREVVRLQFGPCHPQENIVPAWDAARQAIAKAEPKPYITGTPVEDAIRNTKAEGGAE